jgi:glycosyltransferase involved in cell wall biosynthesis
VVPEGVDPGRFQPDTQTHDKYRFLAVGKYEVRKGIDEAIEAFCDAFPDSTTPVELWIKGDFFGDPQRNELLRAKARIDARIKLIEGVFPDDQLPKLYHSADAFVYPSRAEGWGLPCLEAIACGLPVLATNYSGHSEFLAPLAGHVIEIEWDLGPLVDPDYQSLYGAAYKTPDQGNWAIPRRSSIVSGMRALFENHAEWRAHGLAAAEIARHRFSWRASAELALSRIVGEEKVRSG